jgi:hypothetical protein
MMTPTLSADQRNVLAALMGRDASPAQRTEAALRERTGLVGPVLGRVLRELEAFDPPLVAHDVDATLGTRFWWATNAAGDVIDAEA